MFGDPRRNFGIVLRKASEGLADDTELALDRGAQNFICTYCSKVFPRKMPRCCPQLAVCRRDISALQAA